MLELYEELNQPFPENNKRNAEVIFLADLLKPIEDIEKDLQESLEKVNDEDMKVHIYSLCSDPRYREDAKTTND